MAKSLQLNRRNTSIRLRSSTWLPAMGMRSTLPWRLNLCAVRTFRICAGRWRSRFCGMRAWRLRMWTCMISGCSIRARNRVALFCSGLFRSLKCLSRGFIAHKLFHGGMPWLADAFAREDFPERQQQNFDIQPERAVVHVPHIQLEFILPGERIPSVNLRPAGDARENVMTAGLLGRIALQVLHQQGARTHQAHLAAQDVE